MTFQTSVDIANRALQHCGLARVYSLSDHNANAIEAAFTYDKVRRAELQRNIWRFATRRVILRPVDVTTYHIIPKSWSATKIYMLGALVKNPTDGLLYASYTNNNTGNQPDLNTNLWSLYFGPLTATPWLPPGYSLAPTNPPLWVSNQNYPIGSSVSWNGYTYTSQVYPNIGLMPGIAGAAWALVQPSGTLPSVNQTNGYYSGELVYTPANEGYKVFMSLETGNTDTPGVYPTWNSLTTYNVGDTVTLFQQAVTQPGNIPVFTQPGNIPVGQVNTWQSLNDLNLGNMPTAGNPNGWQLVPVSSQPDGRTGQNWLELDTGLKQLELIFPIGSGPLSQTSTRNIFRLPNGYLRHAPTDPKAGTNAYLGAPAGLIADDWTFEGDYIVSSTVSPIMLRFVADISDVTLMDDMFCEGVAARIAKEIAPILVTEQKVATTKLALVERAYKQIMSDARMVNGVETGPVEPPQDSYLSCRY
jgi:hypothetical protein